MPTTDTAEDPRIARTRTVVLQAVIEELAELGHAAFTIESVARRCGVGKSTIYRHWDGKPQLIADALDKLNPEPRPQDSMPPRMRIRALLEHLVHALWDGELAGALPALVEAAERDNEIRQRFVAYNHGRRRALRDSIAAGIDAGHVSAQIDPEHAARSLAGALFYARLLTHQPMTADDLDPLLASILGPDDDPTDT